jgi:predicted component of type VI protein secretion system
MELRLVAEQGDQTRVFHLPEGMVTIGRSRTCTVRIPVSFVSRQHCRLYRTRGFVVAEDLRTANGTLLNGARLKGALPVRPGDRIKIGPIVFVIEYELTAEALEALRLCERTGDVGLRPPEPVPDPKEHKTVRLDDAAPVPAPAHDTPRQRQKSENRS